MDKINTAPWIVTYGVVAVCIIFSNLLMTVVFFKSRTVRRMRTTLFLIGMTAADLIVGAVAIPMYMAILWPRSRLGYTFETSYESIEIASSFASLFLLAVIALERVYSVFWPHRHRSLSRTPYRWGLFVSWFLAVLQMVSYLIMRYGLMPVKGSFLLTSASMAAVMIVITVSYVAIWRKMKTTRVEGLQQRRDLQERKLAKTLALLTGVFLVTWFPFSIFRALVHIDNQFHPIMEGLSWEAFYHIIQACKVLHYSNSFMNPVIYSLRIPQVRSVLAEIFCGRGDRVAAPAALRMEVRRREEEEGGGRGVGGEGGKRVDGVAGGADWKRIGNGTGRGHGKDSGIDEGAVGGGGHGRKEREVGRVNEGAEQGDREERRGQRNYGGIDEGAVGGGRHGQKERGSERVNEGAEQVDREERRGQRGDDGIDEGAVGGGGHGQKEREVGIVNEGAEQVDREERMGQGEDGGIDEEAVGGGEHGRKEREVGRVNEGAEQVDRDEDL